MIANRNTSFKLNLNPGSYEVKWESSGFSSGVYFYTLTTSEFTETRKMILAK